MAKEQMKELTKKLGSENVKAKESQKNAEHYRADVDAVKEKINAAKEGLDEDLVAALEAAESNTVDEAKKNIAAEKSKYEAAKKAAEACKGQIDDKNVSNDNALKQLEQLKNNTYRSKLEQSKKDIRANIKEGQTASKQSDQVMENVRTAIDKAADGL